MRKNHHFILAAKILAAKISTFFVVFTLSSNINAGIPVIDQTNLGENMVAAIENTAQTLKQIQEYQTQLQQYANMLQNTTMPASSIWDDAVTTMSNLRSTIDTLSYYKSQLGSTDAYLQKFGDLDYYESSPCMDGDYSSCSTAEWAALEESRTLGYESQQKANQAMFKGLDSQQDALEADALNLKRLQDAADSAAGRLEALAQANMLAAHQSNQLLQIRGLMMAQNNAVVTRMQAKATEEAKQKAASKAFRRNGFIKSTTTRDLKPNDFD